MKCKHAAIPMKSVGPIKILGNLGNQKFNEEVLVPLATFETPLWPSTARGAKVTRQAGGINVTLIDERMSRSVLIQGESAAHTQSAALEIRDSKEEFAKIVSQSSNYAKLIDIHTQQVADLLYVRFEFSTGDAAGHNMVTIASDRLLQQVLADRPGLSYVSISGNYCCDKKVSAVNGILGRGKHVVAECTVPGELCQSLLGTSPAAIVALNIKKNLLGSLVAGGLRSANAHYANMLLALYLATGQDGANVVEGSQGFTYAEVRGDHLYFSCTLPNIIVGTVGSGKDLPFVEENLTALGCRESRGVGENAQRLALIAAATVLCGELSLLAAQCVPGKLTDTHRRLER